MLGHRLGVLHASKPIATYFIRASISTGEADGVDLVAWRAFGNEQASSMKSAFHGAAD